MNTRYEHEIKRDNGDRIIISINYAEWNNSFKIARIGVLPKRKRNVQYLRFTDDYGYRCLDTKGRNEYAVKEYLKIVTVEEIKEAVMKAYEKMKPVIESEEDLCKMI